MVLKRNLISICIVWTILFSLEFLKKIEAYNWYLCSIKDKISKQKFWKISDEAIKAEDPTYKGRHPNTMVRWHLIGLRGTYLSTCPLKLIAEFCDAYEHARHGPEVCRVILENFILNGLNFIQIAVHVS